MQVTIGKIINCTKWKKKCVFLFIKQKIKLTAFSFYCILFCSSFCFLSQKRLETKADSTSFLVSSFPLFQPSSETETKRNGERDPKRTESRATFVPTTNLPKLEILSGKVIPNTRNFDRISPKIDLKIRFVQNRSIWQVYSLSSHYPSKHCSQSQT